VTLGLVHIGSMSYHMVPLYMKLTSDSLYKGL